MSLTPVCSAATKVAVHLHQPAVTLPLIVQLHVILAVLLLAATPVHQTVLHLVQTHVLLHVPLLVLLQLVLLPVLQLVQLLLTLAVHHLIAALQFRSAANHVVLVG